MALFCGNAKNNQLVLTPDRPIPMTHEPRPRNHELTSPSFYQPLSIVLWARLGLGGILLLTSIVGMLLPLFYVNVLVFVDGLVGLVTIVAAITSLVMGLIWVYKTHQDMPKLYGSYPIEPGGSLAFFMIPFYNLYGIGHTLNTMAKYFQRQPDSAAAGKTLTQLVIWFYVAGLSSNVLTRIVLARTFSSSETLPPDFIDLLAGVVDCGLDWVLIQIAAMMHSGIVNSSRQTE
jgi:hypothetical protein